MLHDSSVLIIRLKPDAIPGRSITGGMQPSSTGEYSIQSAEIGGIGDGIMGARILLDTAEAHPAWMQQHTKTTTLASASIR